MHDIRFPRRPENYLALISRQIIRKHNRTDTDGQIRRMEIRFVEAREAGFPENRYRYRLPLSLFPPAIPFCQILFFSFFLGVCARAKLRHDHATPLCGMDAPVRDVRSTSIDIVRTRDEIKRVFFFLETLYVNRNDRRRFYD